MATSVLTIAVQWARALLPPPGDRRLIHERAGLTQAELADGVGLTQQAIAAIESGRVEPRGERLVRYCHTLQLLAASAAEDEGEDV